MATGDAILAKSRDYARRLEINDFRGTNGWLSKFKKRYGLRQMVKRGEAGSVPCENYLETEREKLHIMNELKNMNNDYFRHFTNICQSSYPEAFNFDDANPPIHQSHTQDFLPSTSLSPSGNVDVISMNTMDYRNTGDYMGDYALYQGNPSVSHFHPGNTDTMDGQLNTPNHDQAETHENSSCPLPVPFQTVCGSSDPYSDTMNDGPTDNIQHLNMANNSSISYILEPTNSGYVFMK
ncbi:7905_t:CDS:2, partial [Paraglomus brasilianum]